MSTGGAAVAQSMFDLYEAARRETRAIVLYRVGEFYEILGPDAEQVARSLQLQLTARPRKGADPVPMCGIPAGRLASYVDRLLLGGARVALSEPDPTGALERRLTLATPATTVRDAALPRDAGNNLLAAHADGNLIGFAWIDLSTGESATACTSLDAPGVILTRVEPREVIVSSWPDGHGRLADALRLAGLCSSLPPSHQALDPEPILAEAYGDAWRHGTRGMASVQVAALGELLRYVKGTLGQLPANLAMPRLGNPADILEIDPQTLRGLEIIEPVGGGESSLLSVLDRCVTAAGRRALRKQVTAPSANPAVIRRRLAMVHHGVRNPGLRGDIRTALGGQPDCLRSLGRLGLGRGTARDLGQVRDALAQAQALHGIISTQAETTAPSGAFVKGLAGGLADCATLVHRLHGALGTQGSLPDTDFVMAGFHTELDHARESGVALTQAIEDLRGSYVTRTGERSLKIRSNTVLGYHIEISGAATRELPSEFLLRQGLASSRRYSTQALDRLATELEANTTRVRVFEERILKELSEQVVAHRAGITRIMETVTAIDVVMGLAQAAAEGHWVEPRVVEDADLHITGGRHPVVERLLEADGRTFVANDCRFDPETRLLVMTGPNMAGKSTFLRQNALIVLMAQIGSFVPAMDATIGIVDKMFSRIGAGDDLAAGRSTFMVEMLETSVIVRQATRRSLVIMDEVGRGTSTHDGLAIAQAVMEHLHAVTGCRALFATHFHELADAADSLTHARCPMMSAAAGAHGDLFTYRVRDGKAPNSFGLKVAALAGMPEEILLRAETILATLRSTRNNPA